MQKQVTLFVFSSPVFRGRLQLDRAGGPTDEDLRRNLELVDFSETKQQFYSAKADRSAQVSRSPREIHEFPVRDGKRVDECFDGCLSLICGAKPSTPRVSR